MAGKYALYLPFHIITALENEGFSDAEIGVFVRGVIKYHLQGIPPRFEDRSLNLLFSSHKEEFDHNITKYNDMVEKRREAGKKGGAPRENRNAAGNRGGGSPRGNRNAAKRKTLNQAPEVEPEKQTQAKQADIELDIDLDSSSTAAAGGGEVVLEKQPKTTTTILNFINESKKAGFNLDKKIAGEIITENPIDPAWLEGPFCFTEFAADTVKEAYSDKAPAEQKRLFISAFKWEDLREEYPAWREKREKEDEAKQRQEAAETEERRKDEARRNPPETCVHCGAILAPDDRNCSSCGWMRFFNDESGEWGFQEPVNLSAEFKQYMARAGP
jgi:hypothetical protein